MRFLEDLESFLRSRFDDYPLIATLVADPCPTGQIGDFTLNCFKIGRFCGNPMNAAAVVTDFLKNHPHIKHVEKIKAFVNLTLHAEPLFLATAANLPTIFESAKLSEAQREKILIEYSAPNTNKPQHLGHVRNNILGMALASMLKRVGHEVIQINLVNDRGIHICKSMLAYQRFGKGETPESSGIKGDHLVGDYYVIFNQKLSEELKQLRIEHPEWSERDNDDLFGETELGSAAQQMLRDWESGKTDVRKLWNMMNSWVFAGFAETYKRMGIKFDHTYLESQTYLLGKDTVTNGLNKGVFAKREDGAVIADLDKLGKKVVLRSDGTSVYITQDIGTTMLKYHDYTPDTMVWVVGDEQNLHFQMLFEILKRLGYDWAKQLYHLSYGMVNLPTGKMKSREGTVVDADDLFAEMVELARVACCERGGAELEAEELATRAECIGMGALKFMLLKFNPKTTITFDPAASLKFEGDTGPYVQYVAARISSITLKAAERGIVVVPGQVNWRLLDHDFERALAVQIYRYPQILRQCAERKDVSSLVEFLLESAKSFNRFYRECPVLNASNTELAVARLALAQAFREIIADGLSTLTVGVPEAM